MNRLREFGFHLKLSRCMFALTEISYLGSIINKTGIKPDSKRTEAIHKMSEPTNVTELRSFLGTNNFNGKLLPNMHKYTEPLNRSVMATALQRRILKQLHQGHQGMVRMKNLARSLVYWPNIDSQIELFVKFCTKCAAFGKSPLKTILQSWPIPEEP